MKMYFCVVESTAPTRTEKEQPGGGKYLTHSQRVFYYGPENFTREIGYSEKRKCELEAGKIRKANQLEAIRSACQDMTVCIEEHEVP